MRARSVFAIFASVFTLGLASAAGAGPTALNIKKPLPLNAPVDVPILSNEAKTYAFACGMGMLKGSVVVR